MPLHLAAAAHWLLQQAGGLLFSVVTSKLKKNMGLEPSQLGATEVETPMAYENGPKVSVSKDLKKRGMSFVGSTIIYAYMQAIGMVNDHTVDCFKSGAS